MGALQAIVQSRTPMTVTQLATITGADKVLIVRLLRPLVALGYFTETDIETYTSTPISQMLTAPHFFGGFQFLSAGATKSLAYLPDYLAMTGFRSVNSVPGPFEYTMGANEYGECGMFEWLLSDPPMLANWNAFMSGRRAYRKQWYEMFPADQIILEDASNNSDDAILLVDIGGGEGQDAEAFRAKFSDIRGRVILQDLPEVINNIKKLDDRVMQMAHDFFNPQPVKGANAYYFRNIFHNWSDVDCLKILKNTASAMKKAHSKLLLFEWILPQKDVPLFPALLDINLMALLSDTEAPIESVLKTENGTDMKGMIETMPIGETEPETEINKYIEAMPKENKEHIESDEDTEGKVDALSKVDENDKEGITKAVIKGGTGTVVEDMPEDVSKAKNEIDLETIPEAASKVEDGKLIELEDIQHRLRPADQVKAADCSSMNVGVPLSGHIS
ncbi:hypothetical protein MMC26_005346 [Xylographa opegraphella]|nr:hypothetical protein [Xylographa opegraphella]